METDKRENLGVNLGLCPYYVAALDVGATECRLAVQMLDAAYKPKGPAMVYVVRQTEMGDNVVSNTEVTTRAVTKVAGRMSNVLGFKVKEMAVLLMAGNATVREKTYTVRCTEVKAGTSSKVVTEGTLAVFQKQSEAWQENEEASDEWQVMYNSPVQYYPARPSSLSSSAGSRKASAGEEGVKRILTNPVGTFTESISSDYLGVMFRKEYVNRFDAVLEQSGITLTRYYLEGVAVAGVPEGEKKFKERHLYLHLGHTKSVLSEVFRRESGELQLSHYAWLVGVGTKFSESLAHEERGCTQEYAYETLKQEVNFDTLNYDRDNLEEMVCDGTFENRRSGVVMSYAVQAVSELARQVLQELQKWYPKDSYSRLNIHLHLGGGIAGLQGISKFLGRCFELSQETRVEMVDLPTKWSGNYKVVSEQSEQQVKEESLYSVLGVLSQEVVRREASSVAGEAIEEEKEEVAESHEAPEQATEEPTEEEREEKKGGGRKSLRRRVLDAFQKLSQGPTDPIA